MKVILNSTVSYHSKLFTESIFALLINKDLVQYSNNTLEYGFENMNLIGLRIIVFKDRKIVYKVDLEFNITKRTNFQKKIVVDFPIIFRFNFTFLKEFSFEEFESLKGSSEKIQTIKTDFSNTCTNDNELQMDTENLKEKIDNAFRKNNENKDLFLSSVQNLLEHRKKLVEKLEKYSFKLRIVNEEHNILNDQFREIELKEFNLIELRKSQVEIEKTKNLTREKEEKLYNHFISSDTLKKY